jgi:hypothetical protein
MNFFQIYTTNLNQFVCPVMGPSDALQRFTEQTYRCYDVLEGQLKKTGGESILPGRVILILLRDKMSEGMKSKLHL